MSNQPKRLIVVTCMLAGIALLAVSLLPSAVATAQSPVCTERLRNGGFETDDGWSLPVTAYRAAYTTAQQHSGNRSARAGIVETVIMFLAIPRLPRRSKFQPASRRPRYRSGSTPFQPKSHCPAPPAPTMMPSSRPSPTPRPQPHPWPAPANTS